MRACFCASDMPNFLFLMGLLWGVPCIVETFRPSIGSIESDARFRDAFMGAILLEMLLVCC